MYFMRNCGFRTFEFAFIKSHQCNPLIYKTVKDTPNCSFLGFLFHPHSRPVEFFGRNCSHAVPIPVPTQIQNYQRMEQNLQPVGLHGSTRYVQPIICLISAPTPPYCLLVLFCFCLTMFCVLQGHTVLCR